MDINQLKKIVEDSLKDHDFSLNLETLSSPGVTYIAKHNLPASTLTFTGASILPPEEYSITVKGTGAANPFKDMGMEAKFYILNEDAALTVKATGDTSYTLNQSFSQFDGTIGQSIVFNTLPQPPSLFLLSDPDEGHDTGLSFAGDIDFKKMTSGISTLLGIQAQHIAGSVGLKNYGADLVSFNLVGPEVRKVNLWVAKDVSVTFKVGSFQLPDPVVETSSPLPFIELATAIPFTSSNQQYTIPLSVKIINLKTFIRLSADITGVVDATLEALSGLVDGTPLSGILPPPSKFPIEKVLRFNALYIDFDVSGRSIKTVGMQVKSTAPWTIFTVASTGKRSVPKIWCLTFGY